MFQAPVEAYDLHIGRYGASLATRLADAAGVGAGQRALDVGCGPGALATELAERLGPSSVAAVDPSAPFVAGARARLPGVDVREAPAEALPFADASFDAALAQLVVNFLRDAPAGVREMARVVRPGGTVAAAVWDYAGDMTLLRAFWDAARALDPAARERDEGVCMRWCTQGSLAGLWASAGLDGVAVTGVRARAAYEDFADLWSGLETGVGPSGAYVVALPAADRAALRAEVARRLDPPDGPFTLTARAWIAVGRVP